LYNRKREGERGIEGMERGGGRERGREGEGRRARGRGEGERERGGREGGRGERERDHSIPYLRCLVISSTVVDIFVDFFDDFISTLT
jgi:hypothetical protein